MRERRVMSGSRALVRGIGDVAGKARLAEEVA